MKRALLLGPILLGLSFASGLLRHPVSKAAPSAPAVAVEGIPVSPSAEVAASAVQAPVAAATPAKPSVSATQATARKRPATRKVPVIARVAPIEAVQPAAVDTAIGNRVFAGSVGEAGEKQPRAPATAESLALWIYQEGDAITPVLSPELRSIPPIRTSRDEPREIENERLPYRGDAPGRRPVQPDGALQTSFGINAPTPTGVNFAGIGVNGVAPSDDNGRVGPNHYVQTVNTQFAVYSKSGGAPLYGPANINTLFSSLSGPCKTQNDGDPIVQYDILADRWIISQFAVNAPPTGLASFQCMAISRTGDPLGAYSLYAFPLSPVLFFDYPHVSTWPDGYYSTFHVFDETKPAAQQFQNQGLVVFERDAMLGGVPARLVIKSIGTAGAQEYFGGLAADLDGLTPPPLGSPEYLLVPGSPEFDGSSAPMIHFFKLATTWGASPSVTVTGPTNILTASFTTNLCGFSRNCVPQPPPAGSSDKLDSIAGQFMWRLVYRNMGGTERMVVKHTVNALVPSANQAAIRWYEIRTPATTPTIFQQGTFAPDGDWRFVGSIAMDNGGNMAMGYSKSNVAVFPEIDITGRLAGDAAGTMGAEIVMQAGVGSQIGTANRWGDYSSMSVDPRDGCTFWYTTQYIPVSGSFTWASRIGAFKFPPANCSAPAQGTLTGTVTDGAGSPIPEAIVKLDNGFSGATDSSGVYTIVLPPGTTNAVASAPRRPECNNSASVPVTINAGSTTNQNFILTGTALLALGPVVLDDSAGNNIAHINKSECIVLDLPLDNLGCAVATGISAVLSSSTSGVTITQANATYPNAATATRVVNTPRYKITTSPGLICGNPIDFTLTVSSSAGTTPIPFSLPTCDTPLTVTGAITAGDATQTARLLRDFVLRGCGFSKACPGTTGSGTRHYDSYTYTNTASTSRCVTVEVTPNCVEVGAEIFTAAYLGSFNPANVCTNYLADPGSSPVNGGTSTYSFDVAAGASFTVVVNEINQNTFCSAYALKVSGLDDLSDGGRPAAPSAGSNGPVCAGGTLNLTASTIPGATYAWTGPNGFTSAQQNPTIPNASLAAGGKYSVVATVAACPSAAGTTTVAVSATPSAAITAPATACAGSTGNVASVPDAGPGATYVWTISGGTLTGGTGTRSVTFTASASGSVTLGVTVSASGGCSAAAGATVAISTSCVGNFFTVTPCRVLDTRHPVGPYGAPSMGADTARTVAMADQCGVPATATAVSINLTITNPTANGFLTLFPAEGAIPITSTINFRAGQTRANNAIPVLNGVGDLGLYCGMPGTTGTVDVIIDVNGYFQ